MTNDEKNCISAGLLVFATATEMIMRFWLLMEKHVLTGQSKQLFNEMQHGIKHAQVYYSRFLEKYEDNLIDMDNDYARVEAIRRNAAFMVRTYLTTLNLNNNGIEDEQIEAMLNEALPEEAQLAISQEVINRFVIR